MDENAIKEFERLQTDEKKRKLKSKIASSAQKKGKNGERYFAKRLTEESGIPFIRIPSSGAFIGKSNRDRIHQYTEQQTEAMLGDIFPPSNLKYRFIVESKNYKSFAWNKLYNGKIPSKLEKWINEISYDTVTYLEAGFSRKPLSFLAMKITRQGNWIVYNKEYFNSIDLLVQNPNWTVSINNIDDKLKQINFGCEWVIEDFNIFLINNKQEMFKCI